MDVPPELSTITLTCPECGYTRSLREESEETIRAWCAGPGSLRHPDREMEVVTNRDPFWKPDI